jgi:hypothetical protein
MAKRFSMNRALGVTKAKRAISRKTGIPLTRSGRRRKAVRVLSGKGCAVVIAAMMGVICVVLLLCFTFML